MPVLVTPDASQAQIDSIQRDLQRSPQVESFDYFDDIRDASGGYDAFAAADGWTIPGDGLSAGIVDGDASAVQANSTDSVGGHLYVGYNPTGITKNNSAGVKVTDGKSTSRSTISSDCCASA